MLNSLPFNRNWKKNKNNCYGFFSSCKNCKISATGVNATEITKQDQQIEKKQDFS